MKTPLNRKASKPPKITDVILLVVQQYFNFLYNCSKCTCIIITQLVHAAFDCVLICNYVIFRRDHEYMNERVPKHSASTRPSLPLPHSDNSKKYSPMRHSSAVSIEGQQYCTGVLSNLLLWTL